MLVKKFTLSSTFKQKLFNYATVFDNVAWLDSHQTSQNQKEKYGTEDTLVALGKKTFIKCSAGGAFNSLGEYLSEKKWAFGFLSYELKNEIESKLFSDNVDGLNFPDLYFFEPQAIVRIQGDEVEVSSDDQDLLHQLSDEESWEIDKESWNQRGNEQVEVKSRLTKEQYINRVKAIKQHIAKGDVYEMNFCHEFYAENASVNPFEIHQELTAYSPTPFSSFFKVDEKYIMCASPERFIKKKGGKVVSQPIKGTVKRGDDDKHDEQLKHELLSSEKERSENIMIVDLVRNDLSQIAKDGSVQVDELCGVYTFAQVHQLISTISCQVDKGLSSSELIQKCFPMGSMTGAPKVKAMELIEEYEESKRGVYSGSIGYFSPDGDFDFNVVIRSILYNATNEYLSFSVGGAITHHSDPTQEYEETLLKAKGMMKVLS
jgi:para-aminobenzoate synthetase component 1